MITDYYEIRPRYSEVDQMGYVYHANYITYCHQARTEMLRKMGICDSILEENNVMLPVISFKIDYLKPAYYDKPLTIKTTIHEMPEIRFEFTFEIKNENKDLISKANTTVVFAEKDSRLPRNIPAFVESSLKQSMTSMPY